MLEKFVLIGGMPRSGTNLVRRIIGSHSRIAIPTQEFQFFRDYTQGKTVRQILAKEKLQGWDIDSSDLYEQSPPDVYVSVLQRYARKTGKEIPGEKSPRNEFYLDLVEDWLKSFDFRCIIMMRNPVDVVASYKFLPAAHGKKEQESGLAVQSAVDWCRSVSLALAKSRIKPRNYYLLKFEDLVSDPRKKTKELCDFIDVEFEEARMLSFSDFSKHKDNTSFAEQDNLQQTDRVYQPGSRKQFLSAHEISTVEEICGELAWALGYDEENFLPSHGPSAEDESAITKPARNRLRRWSKNLFTSHKMHP